MSEERVTYVELKLPRSKKHDRGYTAQKRREFSWRIIAISLGILCFLLLLATSSLGIMYKKHTNKENSSSSEGLSPTTGCDTCSGKWSCCGKMCYYFSKEVKTWDESKKSCEGRGASLIKIDDEGEQKFIQAKIKYNHWIGLYAKGATWWWLDSLKPSQKLKFQLPIRDGKCGLLKLTNIVPAVCTFEFRYICEKNFDILDN
ncbi:T-cell surface glycoprotein YE1/48-like [Talpa occidentalis]|uniref:T-cell surface glycoprotein YE1/48-like n=1 Tax=Talpa occidentalis TaxID=50954 RepID=UPI0023F62EFF|nr:T-cell surface glycoprotein YE1/48-like [Talpa occidentalis]